MMPVFNKEKYLNRSIISILSQNHKCLEIIAIDDGSTDKSNDILKYWMKRDKRVIVHTFKKNKGNIPARIKGVLLSYYNYLFSLDPDDEMPYNCLGQFVEHAIQTSSDMVMGQVMAKYLDGNVGDWDYKMVRESMNKTEMISRFVNCSMNWNLIRLIKRKVFLPAVQLLIDKFYLPILYADDKLIMGALLKFANNYSYYPKTTYIYYHYLPDSSRTGAYFKKKYSNAESKILVNAFLRVIFPKFNGRNC